jgi:hypothetical protein
MAGTLIKVFWILQFVCLFAFGQSKTITIVAEKKSDYKIVFCKSASHWDSLAATELQKYIEEVSGARLSIVNDSSPILSKEIVIGKNRHSKNIKTSVLHDDGFLIKTNNDKIYLIGKEGRGTLNAVYTFLEKYLQCRMYSSTVEFIPKSNSITLSLIDVVENPVFTYRDVEYYETFNERYCLWHKLISPSDKNIWGMFVHTFNTLMPPEKYFVEHPEYYALRNGIRVPEEPCLSNPNVTKIVTEELSKRIAENPHAKIWSVSQNDNFSYCQCSECSKIDEREESPSGSVINFVNQVAKKFPDKIISTLAYQYSRKPPKYLKPENNVNIMLCTIECFRTKPLAGDTTVASFPHDLIGWSKLTSNIFLWDYIVQYTNFVSPFPNFQVLQPNLQLFSQYGIKMIFELGCRSGNASEFNLLKTYLFAKLLWNPNIDADSVMNGFLFGYYGNAGTHIRNYITLMKNELVKSGYKLWIYGDPIEPMKNYLSLDLIDRYNNIFDDAELSVSDQPEYLERVKIARLPLEYAMLEQAKVISDEQSGLVIKTNEAKYIPNPKIDKWLNDLFLYTKNMKDVLLNEKGLTVDGYISRYKRMLSKTMINPLGLDKPVRYLSTPNWKYPANGEKTLTDGKRGDEDHHYNWLGYEGNDMEVVVDLQDSVEVKKVSMDFLQIIFSWIFPPRKIEIAVSNDGNNYTTVAHIDNNKSIEEIDRKEVSAPAFASIKSFVCSFNPVKTRYVKVKAENIKTCPRWHPGYPFKAWIFTDEVVIE